MRQHNQLDGYAGPEQRATNDYLRKRHGNGFMGFPTYRLVYSDYVTTLEGAEWNDWDINLPVELRGRIVAGATGKELVPESKSERVVTEMRRTLEYPQFYHSPGWILERWMAPAYWGAPSEWEDRVVPGTTLPQLGPYPYQGKYMHVAGPYSEAPTGPFLDRLVEQWELMRDEVLAFAASTYVRKRHYEAEERQKESDLGWNRDASAANMTAMQSYASTFLEGGKARQLAAEHAGIQSNYGN